MLRQIIGMWTRFVAPALSLLMWISAVQLAHAQNPPVPFAPPFRQIPADPSCVKPAYPRSALRWEEQGMVRVGFLVDVDGTVLDRTILQSSFSKDLDFATMEAFKKCRYEPPTENGQAAKGWIQIHYRWVIR